MDKLIGIYSRLAPLGDLSKMDLLPRNSFQDSRLCLGSLAGVQPTQEPRSKTDAYLTPEGLHP